MITNVINSKLLVDNKAWSISFLLPKEEWNISDKYHLIKIKDIAEERKGHFNCLADDININYIGLENIEGTTGRLVGFEPRSASDIKSISKIFRKGDILLGRLRPNLNKVFYNDSIQEGVCSTEILVLIPRAEKVNPVYLSALLRTQIVNERIISLVKGASLPRVGIQDLMEMEVPLPDLNLQNQMSKQIMEYYQKLEECYRNILQIPTEIDSMLSEDFLYKSLQTAPCNIK